MNQHPNPNPNPNPHPAWLSRQRAIARLPIGALLIGLGAVCPADQALAQSQFLAYTSACQSDCAYGPTVFWTPPAGAVASSSASDGWSYINTGADSSANYAVSAAAQAKISGVNQWSASSSAGGYFNSPGSFYSNGVQGTAVILLREEFRLPSTASWAGPGWFRLSYRITGDVALNYAETSSSSGQTLGSAQSSITFECGSARVGGSGSSRCESPDFPAPQPGSQNLIGHLDFNSSQPVDRVVSFEIPVYSNQLYVYQLQTAVSSRLTMNATNRTGQINGITAADFSHTFTLVDAQLFDAGFNAVPQWTAQSGSGFDYANITVVPEPATAALLVAGVALLGWKLRRRSACAPSGATSFAL